MTRPTSFVVLTLLAVCASTCWLGCAGQAQTAAPPVDAPEAFSDTGDEVVPDRWWTVFEDEPLSATVDSSLVSNLNLRTAWQRLRAAEAVVDRESSALFPALEGSAQGSVSRTPDEAFQEAENLELGLSSVYEVDLWGRIRSSIAAERFRNAFYGALAMRQLRGTNEIEVRVKLPREQRKDIYHLEDFVVQAPGGMEVPLLDAVEVQESEAFTSINRRDGRRVVTVSMDAQPSNAVSRVIESIRQEVLPRLRSEYPGLTWGFEGSQAEMRQSTQVLWGSFALAMMVIYALLAVAFNSYLQPLIVMGAIPFGIVGAVIGHILLGYDLSLVSLMGVIALSGVVLNDSLIMIDYANKQRADRSVFDAIHEAGLRRFRPIILTTLTTFGGLTPIILETSSQATQLIPMAISLGFGIVFATSIILVIVPCLYMIMEDVISTMKAGA